RPRTARDGDGVSALSDSGELGDGILRERTSIEPHVADVQPVRHTDVARTAHTRRASELNPPPRLVAGAAILTAVVQQCHGDVAPARIEVAGAAPSEQRRPERRLRDA